MQEEVKKFMQSRSMEKVLEKAETPLLNDSEIKRVEIIILKYKSPDMEQDCIDRIIKYTYWPYKINVFDNRGNGPNTSKAWNKLIKESTCDYILLMDSDAFVQGTIGMVRGFPADTCWITEMMKAFNLYKDVAIVGPTCGTNATSTMQSMKREDRDPFCIDGHLSGYCFLTKKSIYDELGYFDEDFCFYGQESDWIERLFETNLYDKKNYKVVVAPRAHVVHGYDNQGSVAARQASDEGELSLDSDSSYSYLMWNFKKQLRLQERGIKYDFKY